MQMNSARHLLPEDRPEFERVLDLTLREAPQHPELAALGQRLNAEQLRTMALGASAAIAACAASEYGRFVALREELRQPRNAPSSSGSSSQEEGRGPGGTVASAVQEGLVEATGAGLTAVISVLAPLLTGAAAVIFLVVGYALSVLSPEPTLAQSMRDAGWVFLLLTALGLLIAAGGLLLTALRNGSSSIRAGRGAPGAGGLTEQVAEAREEWSRALRDRGILPFLGEALNDGRGLAPDRSGTMSDSELPDPLEELEEPGSGDPEGEERHIPRLGYSHPDFTSPAEEPAVSESKATTAGRPEFASPDYSGPEFTSPDFTSPGESRE
ncbi:hypothetical protein [Streptomyces sp. NPDC005438]|uniref:hypothetical protein n=1 Tax=Streptomyces sp. NPDC005438 TaxID=3156880 RepID=UPI0033ACD4B6